jgi:uncharacterized membrane protein YebE (DUF533 family)
MAIDAIKVLGSLLGNGALSQGSGNNALGNILGQVLSNTQNNAQNGASNGGLADILGNVLGGNNANNNQPGMQAQQGGGGLGGMLGGLLGGNNQQGGGLGGMLGGLLGGNNNQQSGNNSAGGGLGDLLGSVIGNQNGSNGGSLSDLLGAALGQANQKHDPNLADPSVGACDFLPQEIDTAQANSMAEIVIKAMINAAKSDGHVDSEEKEKIIGKLGDDITPEEAEFVRNEFNAPLDAAEFASQVPAGMQQQVYAISLMAIDLDTNEEARYLHELAQNLGINQQIANNIHDEVGVQRIYNA